MRESIGGTFLIKIMVVFLVLYNTLLAIAVNYAMAFRVKNQIINLIEEYEGCTGVITGCNGKNCVAQYIDSVGYYRAATPSEKSYLITPIYENNRGTYYKVTTYIKFDFPWIGDAIRANITGETKVVYGIKEGNAQCESVYNK